MELPEVLEYFKKLGLGELEAKIFILLVEEGALSAQDISRLLDEGRTAIYSSLDKLISGKLVAQIVKEHGHAFEACPPGNLKLLLYESEEEIKGLEQELPELLESLSDIANVAVDKSAIKYYSGQKGLEQITWNSTKAKDLLRIYEIDDIDILVGMDFADETLREYVKNKVFDRQLTNLKEMDDCTKVSEFIENWWEARYIPPEEILIQFETMIYNNVYCIYEYQDGEIFCVEIYNEALASTQKQIFDLVWSFATPLKKLNSFGSAVVDEE